MHFTGDLYLPGSKRISASGLSALLVQAAEKLWPAHFTTEAAKQKKEQVLQDMEAVRPVIETG